MHSSGTSQDQYAVSPDLHINRHFTRPVCILAGTLHDSMHSSGTSQDQYAVSPDLHTILMHSFPAQHNAGASQHQYASYRVETKVAPQSVSFARKETIHNRTACQTPWPKHRQRVTPFLQQERPRTTQARAAACRERVIDTQAPPTNAADDRCHQRARETKTPTTHNVSPQPGRVSWEAY